MARRKYVEIGLQDKIDSGMLEEVLSGFEDRIRGFIESKARRRIDELELVIDAEYTSSSGLVIRVDAKISGRLIAPLSYDELLAEALDYAGEWLEEELRRRVGRKGKSTTRDD